MACNNIVSRIITIQCFLGPLYLPQSSSAVPAHAVQSGVRAVASYLSLVVTASEQDKCLRGRRGMAGLKQKDQGV